MATEPKTVNLIVTNACKVDGDHLAVGELLLNVEADLAIELTGAGRTRLATAEDIAAAEAAAKKADKKAAQ